MEHAMNIRLKAMLSCLIIASTATVTYAADCKALQDEKNLIYAAQGYCFKDKEAQKEFGTECHTNKPKFGAAESKRLAEIEEQQKQQKCPKKD